MFDQERFDTYVDSLSADLPEPLDRLEQEALAAGVPIIRKGTQSLLSFLLHRDKPKNVLEVGTAVGFSALFMKAHLPEGSRITTIEKVEMRLVEDRSPCWRERRRRYWNVWPERGQAAFRLFLWMLPRASTLIFYRLF